MSTILDAAIGLFLMYGALALIVTTMQELLASLLAARSKRLYAALSEILTGSIDDGAGGTKPLLRALYEHPLIRNLADRVPALDKDLPGLFARGLPSYIPSKTFVVALLDVLRGSKTAADTVGAGELLANAHQIVGRVSDPELKCTLTLLVGDAEKMATAVNERSQLVSERLEAWFNDRMARAAGWYKRRAQAWSFALAVVVTVAFNADSLHVATRLWGDAALRETVVAVAQAYGETRDDIAGTEGLGARLVQQSEALAAAGLPIGWYWPENALVPCARRAAGTVAACWAPEWWQRAAVVIGWLVTTLAVSLGAAFWFDVLSRALRLRGAGARVSVTSGRVDRGALEAVP